MKHAQQLDALSDLVASTDAEARMVGPRASDSMARSPVQNCVGQDAVPARSRSLARSLARSLSLSVFKSSRSVSACLQVCRHVSLSVSSSHPTLLLSRSLSRAPWGSRAGIKPSGQWGTVLASLAVLLMAPMLPVCLSLSQ